MVRVTVIIAVVVTMIVAAGVGVGLFNRFRRKDRLVATMCHLYESEPLNTSIPSADSDLRQSLVSALKDRQSKFDFDQFIQESGAEPDVARQVAEGVYRRYFELSHIDGIIDRSESQTLTALAEVLHLGNEMRDRIEEQVAVCRSTEFNP